MFKSDDRTKQRQKQAMGFMKITEVVGPNFEMTTTISYTMIFHVSVHIQFGFNLLT